MLFGDKNPLERPVKKMDKLVTGIIIGGAVASMIGLSRMSKAKKLQTQDSGNTSSKKIVKHGYSLFGKTIVCVLKIFTKK